MTRAKRGQTLIEVLVAMTVLGVALVGIMEAFAVCSYGVAIIKGRGVARDVAARMMAELRSNPSLLRGDESGEVGPEHPGVTWRRELREGAERGTIAARITVEWRSRGVARQYVLVSLLRAPNA